MDDPEINGVELEELIFKAAHYDRQALITLLYCEWMTRLFERLADWAQRRYKVDGEEVRDYVFDRIHSQSRSPHKGPRKPWLNNPHRSSWRSCLTKWAYMVAKNRCLNILVHYEVESRHVAALEHEHTTRIEHGVRIVAPSARTPSPEEELERKEQASLEEKIHEKAWQVFDSSTEECQMIASLWAGDGMTLGQIAAKLGSSTETVRRKLKKFQNAVFEEVRKGIAEETGEQKTEESGLGRVLAEIVENREDLNDLLPTGTPVAPTVTTPAGPEPEPDSEPEAPRPRGPRTRRRKNPGVARAA
jgi:RNA polymerase sigma factor (sigma-70 family)